MPCWSFVGIRFGESTLRIVFQRYVYDIFKNLILMSTTHYGENDDSSYSLRPLIFRIETHADSLTGSLL